MGGTDRLEDIATDWHRLADREHLVLRYAGPARAYLRAVLRDSDAADEVAQRVMLRVVDRGLPVPAGPGRFRDYLKAALRNAARTYHRAKPAAPLPPDLPAGDDPEAAWLAEWRRCVLDRVWDALADHEQRSRGNLARTVLRAHLDHPAADSTELADRVGLRPAAFRQQLSRARRLFAALLAREVGATLRLGTPEQVADELAALGFLHYVRDYLVEPEA
jgi:DNA-directed RNA polymerase specialized sigma24 family protein